MSSSDYSSILDEFEQINIDLQDPSITNDPKKLETFSRRLTQISPIAANIKKLNELEGQLKQTEEIIKENNDSEFTQMARDELSELKPQIEKLESAIIEDLKTSDPNDGRNAIIEIRAGTGGEEASLFASDLFRMYSRYCEKNNWKMEILNTNYSGNSGFKEVIGLISGDGVYGQLKFESGVHRVQRVPSTESAGRIHTSAASVVILPEVEDVDVAIDPSDLRIDVYRSSGPGGQSVNTTDSAVRITHIPTGLVISCQDEKSQHKNKARAMSILKSKLYEFELEKQEAGNKEQRRDSIKSGDRSAKIRTYNFPDSRITDHRIHKTWYNLQTILDGDLDEVISTVKDELTKLEIDEN
jgi:peptide chain release factor 1